ncbi:MAG: hypothetical protein U1E70_06935 [Acetobacteraceae bacterium]|nr:hypothetical protein [Pseudomonadota bacterium]
MSAFPPAISPAVFYTILDLLLPLFLRYAGTREEAADVVMNLLIEQAPQTNEELGLAAEIIGFRYKALGLIRDSEDPDIPLAVGLQLSKTASALRRNEGAAQRKLDALRRARLAADKAASAAVADTSPADPAPPRQRAAPTETPPPPAAPARPARDARIDAFLQHLTEDPAAAGLPPIEALADGLAAALDRARQTMSRDGMSAAA